MKEPAMTSPFSAMNSREQKEQWICWQCAHGTGTPAAAKPTEQNERSVSLPPLHLPNAEEPKPTACTEKPTDSRFWKQGKSRPSGWQARLNETGETSYPQPPSGNPTGFIHNFHRFSTGYPPDMGINRPRSVLTEAHGGEQKGQEHACSCPKLVVMPSARDSRSR